jgi:hypothetical protein
MQTVHEVIEEFRRTTCEARQRLRQEYGLLEYRCLSRQWIDFLKEQMAARDQPLIEVVGLCVQIEPDFGLWLMAAGADINDQAEGS